MESVVGTLPQEEDDNGDGDETDDESGLGAPDVGSDVACRAVQLRQPQSEPPSPSSLLLRRHQQRLGPDLNHRRRRHHLFLLELPQLQR